MDAQKIQEHKPYEDHYKDAHNEKYKEVPPQKMEKEYKEDLSKEESDELQAYVNWRALRNIPQEAFGRQAPPFFPINRGAGGLFQKFS